MNQVVRGSLTAVALGLLFLPSFSFASFGISPPYLHADHLVPGARYVQTIYLVQDKPDQDLPIQAKLEIAESVRSWVSIDPGFTFTIPQGVRQFPVKVMVTVPKDAPLTAYHGEISFTGTPSQAGQVTIALGVKMSIDIRVGNDIFQKINIPIVRLLDIEEGWNPRVYVKFENEGNVAESLTGATYELYDRYGSVLLSTSQRSDGFPEIAPFSADEFTLEFPVPLQLGVGEYWGRVNLYQQDKIVGSQKTVFNVLKRGSLSNPGTRIVQFLAQNWVVGAGVLALVGAGMFLAYRKTRRRSAA